MEKLVKRLNEAAKAYYSGKGEIMTDKEYDALYDQLVAMEKETGVILPDSPTQRVGYAVVTSLPKVTHEYPALSLDKTKLVPELVSWANGKETVLSWKCDGLTLQATYNQGRLKSAVTRGNGLVGEDVTHNAPYIAGLPMEVPYTGKLVVRGEVMISYADFTELNQDGEYKNPRNLASASLRLFDSFQAAKRCLHFKAFTLVAAESFPAFYDEALEFLQDLGFHIVDFRLITDQDIQSGVEAFEAEVETYPFPTDGLVLTYRDLKYGTSLGTTGKFPKHSIAFKWQDDVAETKLIDIEWSASRTGLINPVAVFEPVELEGTTVSRASVHNIRYLEEKELGYGDTITVYKANMIIPCIDDNLTRSGNRIPIPSRCPVCGHPTERRVNTDDSSESLYCTNPDCAAKHVGRFVRLAERDGLNIVGISKSAIEQFVSNGFLKTFRDFYHLSNHKEKIMELEGFGEKSYTNLISSIEKSRNTTFRQFFYALGIPGVGHDMGKILEREFACHGGYGNRSKVNCFQMIALSANAREVFLAMDGVGSTYADSMIQWMKQNEEEYNLLLQELCITDDEIKAEGPKEQPLKGLTFVITGSLNHYTNREELKAEIEGKGGKVSGSVSKKTSYLISNEDSNSGKSKKARELGISVLTEEMYQEMFSKNII